MVANSQSILPDWFAKSYLFVANDEHIDRKKWTTRMIIAILWLTIASISLISKPQTVLRMVASPGYELFGEFAHRVGNIGNVFLMVQYITCQIVQYTTFRTSNQLTLNLLEPLKSSTKQQDLWNKLLKLVDIMLMIVCVGLPTYSAYIIYFDWLLILHKVGIGCIMTSAASAALRLLTCNCLYLQRTCRSLNGTIVELNLMILRAHDNRFNTLSVTIINNTFQAICSEVANHNRYWKKLMFLMISSFIPFISATTFIISEFKSPLFYIPTMLILVQIMIAASMVILTPAHVESKMRKCYPSMCQLLRYRSMNWRLKLKLLGLVKQFDNQISFTSWDTSKLDYLDYNEVRYQSHYDLLDK